MELTKVSDLMSNLLDLLKVPKPKDPQISSVIVLASKSRSGMSAQEMAAEVIRRRSEAGLPVGLLPDGEPNPDEQMEIIRFQVLLDALSSQARTTVAIQPGISFVATGQTGTGQPVIVKGSTTGIGVGSAIIQ